MQKNYKFCRVFLKTLLTKDFFVLYYMCKEKNYIEIPDTGDSLIDAFRSFLNNMWERNCKKLQFLSFKRGALRRGGTATLLWRRTPADKPRRVKKIRRKRRKRKCAALPRGARPNRRVRPDDPTAYFAAKSFSLRFDFPTVAAASLSVRKFSATAAFTSSIRQESSSASFFSISNSSPSIRSCFPYSSI